MVTTKEIADDLRANGNTELADKLIAWAEEFICPECHISGEEILPLPALLAKENGSEQLVFFCALCNHLR